MTSLLALTFLTTLSQESPPITVNVEETRVTVQVGDEPFTELHHATDGSPYLYPVLGPGGAPLTRGYPMDPRPGEARDHPHHRSLWLAHGSVNGYDFWHSSGRGERIVLDELIETRSGAEGLLRARYRWMAEGRPVLTEERGYRFSAGAGSRRIEVASRFVASDGPVVFGDTKEGTFALRLAQTLRLSGRYAAGSVRNSEGVKGKRAWGKRASWVAYHGPIPQDGTVRTFTVAIFDHPENPRHPTWWHARDYGLFAANPFGAHDFEGQPAGSGELRLAAGEALELRYRVLLHAGEASDEELESELLAFAVQAGDGPKVPRDYELVVDEGFESAHGLERFAFSDPEAWEHHEANGGSLALVEPSDYAPPHRSPLSIALLRDPLVASFVLEAEVQQTGREYGHRDLCLFFGFGAPDRFYYAHLASEPDEHAHNVFRVAGEPREALAPVPTHGVDWGEEQWHVLRLTRELASGRIRVDFDGRTVLEATDRTHGYGRVGFGSFDDTGRIRRLRVWASDVRHAPQGADPFRP